MKLGMKMGFVNTEMRLFDERYSLMR